MDRPEPELGSNPLPKKISNENGFRLTQCDGGWILTLAAQDGMNRLTRSKMNALRECLCEISESNSTLPLIIAGEPIFSAGADLNEINQLTVPDALGFAYEGQRLMNLIANFPAPVFAAIRGFCFGGGLDLALACHRRIATPNAVFGHRGAALGLITGWGGTQRLPRLIGKGHALQMFVEAEKVDAGKALRIGLIDAISNDPVCACLNCALQSQPSSIAGVVPEIG